MNASDLSTLQWLALAVGAVMIGVSKTGIPGIGILAIVLIAGVVPARASTGLVLPMLILADIFAVTYYRRHAVWRHLTRMLPFAVAGVLAGSLAWAASTTRSCAPSSASSSWSCWPSTPGASHEKTAPLCPATAGGFPPRWVSSPASRP